MSALPKYFHRRPFAEVVEDGDRIGLHIVSTGGIETSRATKTTASLRAPNSSTRRGTASWGRRFPSASCAATRAAVPPSR